MLFPMSGESMPVDHIADLVDRLLSAQKSFAGSSPDWVEGNREEEVRFTWPVLINGESHACYVAATAYPNFRGERFTISLIFKNSNIWRIDYEPDFKRHTNPFDRASLLGSYEVRGKSYHSWEDNRYLATHATLPKKFECARHLPENVQGWENAFRWFCGQTNIDSPHIIPSLPKMTRLPL